jgi:poly(3-hydroxyalkanoate) synthetase
MDQAASLVKNGKLQLETQNSKNLESHMYQNQILDIKNMNMIFFLIQKIIMLKNNSFFSNYNLQIKVVIK